jgi:DNA-binding GntR family transcriptional regulator
VNRAAPHLQVDRNSPVPLYFQVTQHVEQLIKSGDLAPGTRLENEIDLTDQLGLFRWRSRAPGRPGPVRR